VARQLDGKVVIVTGASAGIGRATVEALADRGANVVMTARRHERLVALAAQLASRPGKRVALGGDIGQEEFVHELVERTVAEFGRLDVLVNNAGVGHNHPLAEMPAGDMRTLIDTNLLGPLYGVQAAIPHMKRQGGGQIVNVSSIVGQRPIPGQGVYCASKAAVNFASRALRMELRPFGIVVTLVYPGRTRTDFGQARLGGPLQAPTRLFQVSAERAGQAVARAIEKRQTEVYVTAYDWLFTHLSRLFPRTLDRLFELRSYQHRRHSQRSK
jgi:NAD(P)-dependent dehydrogenase (short-subunit alcohol dehydrogenase family)